ncbi:hypothetical protein [Ramlibacter sp. AN1133]|uniref:hypothetical protein n=1 Tax=Ramlibacter sp. AN1133 TaxID=3133429 RepID=UPI0030BE9775
MLKFPARAAQPEQEEPLTRGRLPRFGVALFDESRQSGWACLVDMQPFRFRQPQDLPNDCVWVCSATGTDFRPWAQLAHIRSADYVSKLHYLAHDYGLRVEGEGKFGQLAQQACAQLAPTIHRTMVIASQVYGWTDPSTMLRGVSLTEDIRKCLVAPPAPRNFMRGMLQSAYQSYSKPVVHAFNRASGPEITITMRYNRLEYAKRLLAQQIPDGHWTCVSDSAGYPLDKALDPAYPSLVTATVEFVGKDAEISDLCAFGADASRGMLRSHISQPELQWLSKHARIHITSAHVAATGKPLPSNAQLPELLTSDPLFSLSVPAGLVAEAHWKAIGTPTYNPRAASGDKREFSSWAVWLRAHDRAFSFELAMAAHQAGFRVLGYGNGAATVRVEKERLPQLLDFCMENEIAHPAFRSIFQDHGLCADE